MKSVWNIWVWVTYCLASMFYFATYNVIDPMYSKILFLGSSIALLGYCIWAVMITSGNIAKGFLSLALSALLSNLVLVLLYHLIGFDGYKLKFCFFITFEIISAAFIYILGKKHDLFQNE